MMRKTVHIAITTLVSLSALFPSCGESVQDGSRNEYLDKTIEVSNRNVPLDSLQNYYPYKIFKDTSQYKGAEKFLVNWFSKHLFAMKEPLLFNKNSNRECFRFLWLRTFHEPVAIRIERNNNDVYLFWKKCDGAGGYEPGNLIINKRKKLTTSHWNTFTSKIDSINFWTENVNDFGGLDGSEWILEGASPINYHVIHKWSPKGRGTESDDIEKYYKICRYLIDLTDLEISEELIY